MLLLKYVLVCAYQGTEQTQTPLKSERLKGWRGNPRTSQAQRGNCLEPWGVWKCNLCPICSASLPLGGRVLWPPRRKCEGLRVHRGFRRFNLPEESFHFPLCVIRALNVITLFLFVFKKKKNNAVWFWRIQNVPEKSSFLILASLWEPLAIWTVMSPRHTDHLSGRDEDTGEERMQMKAGQPCSSIATSPSQKPVPVTALCKVAASASSTFCPFCRRICMTDAKREVCCPGNGLTPSAVGAEVLLEEVKTMASEMRSEQYMFVCPARSPKKALWIKGNGCWAMVKFAFTFGSICQQKLLCYVHSSKFSFSIQI